MHDHVSFTARSTIDRVLQSCFKVIFNKYRSGWFGFYFMLFYCLTARLCLFHDLLCFGRLLALWPFWLKCECDQRLTLVFVFGVLVQPYPAQWLSRNWTLARDLDRCMCWARCGRRRPAARASRIPDWQRIVFKLHRLRFKQRCWGLLGQLLQLKSASLRERLLLIYTKAR